MTGTNMANATTTTAPAMAAPPAIPPMETADSFNPDFSAAPAPAEDGALASPMDAVAPASPEQRTGSHDVHTQQRVHEVLQSDVGVSTLLNRLKASIASARVCAASRLESAC
jgi:hypothetical protein|tara:strand:+ start:5344 stop:5679 length:336 start_codon:yes stop_codon:yes gene_type:complete